MEPSSKESKSDPPEPIYRRVLLKLSGEALMGRNTYGIDPEVLGHVARQLVDVHQMGIQLAIVVGGGNIFRGLSGLAEGYDRASADYMGMLATMMNCLALQDAIEKEGVVTRIQSALMIQQIAEPYIRRRAVRHLEKERVVIFGCGTGNPFFTTDTAAALRAIEIGAEVLLKATKVDGVYDKDPMIHPEARLFSRIGYLEAVQQNLEVMDLTAISLCRTNKLPIRVFNLNRKNNIRKVMLGTEVGTLVNGEAGQQTAPEPFVTSSKEGNGK